MSRRAKAPDRIGRRIGPLPRFLAGAAALPPFLMTGHLPSKAVLVLLFAVLAVLAGKRIRWGYFLILAASIVFFHLLTPWGRVLAEWGPFAVTVGALENGAVRALTLIGMIFLSVAAVRPELALPGRLGGLLARSFYYFEILIDGKASLDRKNLFAGLDALLLERFDPGREDFGHAVSAPEGSGETAFRGRGWGFAFLVAAVPWGLWILDLLDRPWI